MSIENEIAIKVQNISKTFKLPHEKQSSIKSVFVNLFRTKRSYERQHVLKDISFEIKKGEFFGIVGRNGSGKSTLLKVLAGIYVPTKGKVSVIGKLVPFIELGVGFNPELTGRENVYLNGALLGFSRKEMKGMYNDIVEFAELEKFMDQKLKNYSSGMQVRLAFSVAVRAEADILLVDEVLAVGDADFQRKCFTYFKSLKRNKQTVVFVSHDMDAVREYCDRTLLIDQNRIVSIGEPTEIAKEYTRMFMSERVAGGAVEPKRWGSFDMKYASLRLSPKKLTKNSPLIITAEAVARKKVHDVVFGFSIRDTTGRQLLGTNSLLQEVKIKTIDKADKKEISWEVPHIFNDGEYYVSVAIVQGTSINTYDWWEDAAKFVVVRESHTPYPVNPFVKLRIKKLSNSSARNNIR